MGVWGGCAGWPLNLDYFFIHNGIFGGAYKKGKISARVCTSNVFCRNQQSFVSCGNFKYYEAYGVDDIYRRFHLRVLAFLETDFFFFKGTMVGDWNVSFYSLFFLAAVGSALCKL